MFSEHGFVEDRLHCRPWSGWSLFQNFIFPCTLLYSLFVPITQLTHFVNRWGHRAVRLLHSACAFPPPSSLLPIRMPPSYLHFLVKITFQPIFRFYWDNWRSTQISMVTQFLVMTQGLRTIGIEVFNLITFNFCPVNCYFWYRNFESLSSYVQLFCIKCPVIQRNKTASKFFKL
jgi:hypothetical protein